MNNPIESTVLHMSGCNVATCENCNDARLKRTTKIRVQIKGDPTFCPDCGHALYWERITMELNNEKR